MARTPKPSGRKSGKSRSVSDLNRARGYKTPKKVIIIICEGEKTEPLYFKAIRRHLRIPLEIIHGGNAPISVVDRAIQEKEDLQKGDEVWCVFDVEQTGQNPTFRQAVDKAKRYKLHLAITNPAFEYWYLLHYECADRPFINANEVEDQLKKHLPNYDKSVDLYNDIGDKTEIAIQNADTLRRNAEKHWEDFPNSSTGVDKLVAKILEMND